MDPRLKSKARAASRPPTVHSPDVRDLVVSYLLEWRKHPLYHFTDVLRAPRTIEAQLSLRTRPCSYDYMDDRVRSLCAALAEDLRDLIGRNVFFDLCGGRLVVHLQSGSLVQSLSVHASK